MRPARALGETPLGRRVPSSPRVPSADSEGLTIIIIAAPCCSRFDSLESAEHPSAPVSDSAMVSARRRGTDQGDFFFFRDGRGDHAEDTEGDESTSWSVRTPYADCPRARAYHISTNQRLIRARVPVCPRMQRVYAFMAGSKASWPLPGWDASTILLLDHCEIGGGEARHQSRPAHGGSAASATPPRPMQSMFARRR